VKYSCNSFALCLWYSRVTDGEVDGLTPTLAEGIVGRGGGGGGGAEESEEGGGDGGTGLMGGVASLMVGLLGLLKGPSALELRTHNLFGNFTAFPGFELVDEGKNMEGRVGVRDIFEYRNRIEGWML